MTIYYTREHEWIGVDGNIATVGLTQYAADALGDLVFAEVKSVGSHVKAADAAATVESVKAASEIYAPISGEIVEINTRIGDDPGLINSAPEGDGWLFKLQVADPGELSELLDREAYDTLVAEL